MDKHSFSLNYSSTIVRKARKSPLNCLCENKPFYLVGCSTHLYYCNVKGHIDSFKQAFKNSPTKCFNSSFAMDVFQYFRKEADTAGSFCIDCWFNCEISHHKRELPVIPLTPSINDFSSHDSQQ